MSRRWSWRTFARYLALQSPGWLLAGIALYLFVRWEWLSPGSAVLVGALWVTKDFALYPWLRPAYEKGDPDPSAALRGRTARARERIAPRGYVQLGSELWRAELAPGRPPIEAGAQVRVLAVRGLTLLVEPV